MATPLTTLPSISHRPADGSEREIGDPTSTGNLECESPPSHAREVSYKAAVVRTRSKEVGSLRRRSILGWTRFRWVGFCRGSGLVQR